MEVLKEYTDVFAANPKAVAACKGPPMRLELKDPNSAPCVTPMRHYTPEQRKMIQAEIEKLYKAGAIVPSTSQYASCCHTVRKKDGTVRVVQDFQGLNALLKAQSGGLGDLLTSCVLLVPGSRLGIPTTDDPRGRQAPHRVSRCGREVMGIRTLRIRSQNGALSFRQLRRW